MGRSDAPLMERGLTDSGTSLSHWAGRVFEMEDYDMDNFPKKRTEHRVCVRLVKNSAGIALTPGRLVRYKAGTNRTEVDGYTTTTAAEIGGVVDEWLPAAGVANGSYFYVVIHGPTTVKTSLAANAENVINEGDVLVSLTGATSGATTSGRVATQDLTGATDVLGNQVQNALGRALSAKTTANTNTDVLVFKKHSWD